MSDKTTTDYQRLATKELMLHGDKMTPQGSAARHRARTWAMLALAQATEPQPDPKPSP